MCLPFSLLYDLDISPRHLHRLKTLFCLLAALCSGGSSTAYAYSDLIIFGDSLSDTGNAVYFFDLPSPYYNNRISDGPLAVDHLATKLGLSTARSGHLLGNITGSNYAVDGARAYGSDTEDLDKQVDSYLDHTGNLADPAALYLVAIGGNDVRSIRTHSPAAASSQIEHIAASIKLNSTRLLSRGAKTLLIANIPDIGRIPETLADGTSSKASTYTRQLNLTIERDVALLRGQYQADIKLFDFYAYFAAILDQASQYGFTHTTAGCYTLFVGYHSACGPDSFDHFVFFDSIHPTGATHRLLGQGLFEALASTPDKSSRAIAPFLMLLLD